MHCTAELRPAQPPKAAASVRLILGLALAGLLAGCGAGGADSGSASKAGVVTTSTPTQGLTITTGTLPAGQPGSPYPTTALAAVNASGTVTWSLAAGALPSGMALSA